MGSRRVPGWGVSERVGGDSEDDGPVWTPGPASRSYLLSVRPETRSTFCSIIAQLTEETQPLFETTLKSRAVSEDSDVRFTCIVTGYPEPEVTWYKDDTELDRYCGLPKYEITHQGNRHTLQLYRCREEDAAIYQASARNTKGIVSCSGVLEVGTMTEYKIHQRWFAKLKRKAAAKMRELEQSWRHGKEAPGEAEALRKLSPDRFQRKRRLSGPGVPVPSAPFPPKEAKDEAPEAWQEGDSESAQHPGLGLINSFAPSEAPTNGEPASENGEDGAHSLLTYICEAMERGPPRTPQKKSGAKKKRKDEESKPGLKTPELEKAVRTHHSAENCVPSDKPASGGTQGPVGPEQVQAQLRVRAARGSGSPGTSSVKKPAPAVGTQDRAHDGPSQVPAAVPATGPGQEGYFSLKDIYMESTLVARPQGQGKSLPPSVRAPAEHPPGKVPIGSRGAEMSVDPGQHTPSSEPQPARPLNRKRFAPPKPKGEPHADSQLPSSLNGALDRSAQSSGQVSPQASAHVPTPPARRKHSSRDSPVQGRASHRPPPEQPQAAEALTVSASSSSGGQGVVEPMDTETQEDRRTFTDDQRTRGGKSSQVQVAGRTEGEGEHTAQRTRVNVVTKESERLKSDRSLQKDVVMQRSEESQVERVPEDERTQEDKRMQEGGGTEPEGCVPPATEGHPGQQSATHLSSSPRAAEHQSSEGSRSTEIAECSALIPEASAAPEKPGSVLRSEEPTISTSRSHEDPVLGPLPASLMCPAQPPPQGIPGSGAGEGHLEPEESGPAKAKQEEQPKVKPYVALGGCPLAGPSLEVSTKLCLPGPGLTNSPQEGLPSTSVHQPTVTAGDQAGLSSVPILHSEPKPPMQSPLPETVATSSKGACAKEPVVEERVPAARSCDPGLIDSLKNYLLLLLKLSSTEASGAVTESPAGAAAVGMTPSPGLVPTVEVAGLSPRTSRRILERVENNHLVQSAQTLLLSPCTSRRLTGLLDQEVQAGRQALAIAQAARGPGPSPLAVPAIVVGEEGPQVASGVSLGGSGLQASERRAPKPYQEEAVPEEALPGLPAATPEELALGARRKRFVPKVRAAGDGEVSKSEERESPSVSPRGPRKNLAPVSPGTPGREKRSPTQGRKATLEVPRAEQKPAEGELGPKAGGPDAESALDEDTQDAPAKPRKAKDLLKAPQVIRKIRVEQFPDASGSLKLWCQFFNILSDSVLTWAKDQRPVGEVGRSAGDEGPAALAIVQAAPADCGMYRCTISNEHGSASTDFCLSPEVLSGFVSREEGEVGEEIEMTPMVFAKGLADSGCWGDKLFGRLVSEELRGGGHGGGLRKASQAKVIYGLEPIFESGRTCIIKVCSPLVFGPSSETSLLGRNYDVTIQGCKIQNMSREYCKIFAAEARAAPQFGEVPEIIPLYLIYRPANTIPYATLEEDLGESLQTYCSQEGGCTGSPAAPSSSEVVQKCQAFQHWLYQWTNGSFLVTDLAGVEWKMTDVQIATKLRGYQGLKESCFPALLDHFASSHQCNTYCEMLGLTALKGPEAAHPQAKPKGSKSPSAGRKGAQLSPQPQKKGPPSPQGARRSTPSPRATSQVSEATAVQVLGQPPSQEGSSKAQR